jgi:hypothetical protein
MTFGVPYSFVPGTKAKADEVNANFIDVLTKIENTNLRIDETNSNVDSKNLEVDAKFEQVGSSLNLRANLDFSNISSVAQAKFDAKANVSDIDGSWVSKSATLMSTTTLSNTDTKVLSLSSYLPNDGNVYEVLMYVTGVCSSTGAFNFTTNYGGVQAIRCKNNECSCVCILPVNTSRELKIIPSGATAGTTKAEVFLRAYRKVR